MHKSRVDQRRAWLGASGLAKLEEELAEAIPWARGLVEEWTNVQRAAMYSVMVVHFAGVNMDEVWPDNKSLERARLRLHQLAPKPPMQSVG